jgi:hypothetical protein
MNYKLKLWCWAQHYFLNFPFFSYLNKMCGSYLKYIIGVLYIFNQMSPQQDARI